MHFVLGMVARIAIALGMVVVLGKTVPSMPNRMCRFVFFSALGLAFSFLVNYFDVRLLGRHPIGWGRAFVIALAFAIWGTFLIPEPRRSNAP
jgi:hypothetical protein